MLTIAGSDFRQFQHFDPSMSPPPIKQQPSSDECDASEDRGIQEDDNPALPLLPSWPDPVGLQDTAGSQDTSVPHDTAGLPGYDADAGVGVYTTEEAIDQLRGQSDENGNVEPEISRDTNVFAGLNDPEWNPDLDAALEAETADAGMETGFGTFLPYPSNRARDVNLRARPERDLPGTEYKYSEPRRPNIPSRNQGERPERADLDRKLPAINYPTQALRRSGPPPPPIGPHPGGSAEASSIPPPNFQVPAAASLQYANNPPSSPLRRRSTRKRKAQSLGETPSSRKVSRKKSPRKSPPEAGGPNSSSSSSNRTHHHLRFHPRQQELDQETNDRAKDSVRSWYTRLNEYDEYYRREGHGSVPQKYPPNPQLANWVNKQRMEKKARDEDKQNKMYDWKIERLNEASFVWAKPKGQTSWELQFKALKDYIKSHGDCNVPTKYKINKPLGRWVSTQRSNYKRFKDNTDDAEMQRRFDLLNEVGFSWVRLPSPTNSNSSGSHSNDETNEETKDDAKDDAKDDTKED